MTAEFSDHANGDTAQEDSSIVKDAATQFEAIVAERDALLAEKNEWAERLMRRQADFENFRRRTEREKADTYEFAAMDAVRSVLPILDDFERALNAETPDKDYAKGMELIYNRLFDALKKMGLEPIESEGTRFDPHVHHAIEMVSGTGAADQTVVEQLQKGYNFKGRLLRPAMVRVAAD